MASLIRIALDLAGSLYTDGIAHVLKKGGKFRVYPITPENTAESKARSCKNVAADVALLGVSLVQDYTVNEREKLLRLLRRDLPTCKLVILLDENLSQSFTDKVKNWKLTGEIDGFLYTSVSLDYMADMLETIIGPGERY